MSKGKLKILILGSSGFIGSNLVDFFLSQHHHVYGCDVVDNDRKDFCYFKISIISPDFELLFKNFDFDICVNASGSGNVSFSISHPFEDYNANVFPVIHILEAIRKNQQNCRYIHLSSAAVYGNPSQLPVEETDQLIPVSPYGFHKWMSEIICREYYELYNLKISIIRPFSVYGIGLKKQLLWEICKKASLGTSVLLFGSGSETRDFIHISDLAVIISKIIAFAPFTCEAYNAATGTETSIRFIAEIFEQYFPIETQIKFSGVVKEGDPLNWRANISSINNLGFVPSVDLKTAIINYINWFINLRNEF